MKIALVHDYLNQFGGGERVLLHLMKMFPGAPVFTLLHDSAKTRGLFEGRVRKTSFLDVPIVRRAHRFFIPLMPLATSLMNLGDEFDLVISDTHGFVKGIGYGKKTKHLSYCHTPLRYAWEPEEYFGHSLASKLFRFIFAPAFAYVRNFDYRAGQKPDVILSNSEFIRNKVQRYYGRDSQVLYPPVDTTKFYFDQKIPQGDYFLAFGRFMRYKRFDIVIEAFNKLGLPLKIAGAGRDEARLRRLVTSPNIEFVPFQSSDDDVRRLYAGARALVFPQVEDFGLVAAEAQMCGTPVIAFNAGGAKEIVADGKTGLLFNEQTPEALMTAVRQFEGMKFDRNGISKQASRFSAQAFTAGIERAVKGLVSQV